MIKKIYKRQYHYMMISFGIVITIIMFLYSVLGYAPFGEKSLVVADANIQYLDFFAYFKDILEGNNSIGYSFGKVLGGSNIAVFSYYLSSPLNLLIAFFEKESLHFFFHMLIAIKLALAAATFSYFIVIRFGEYLSTKTNSNLMVIMLSVSYGLSQYSVAQSSNIMWLDGVYMLPLMLAAVYEVVNYKKIWRLSLFVGASILFNWYTGGINCLFTIIWFFFELTMKNIDETNFSLKQYLKEFIVLLIKYGSAMVLGVLLSAILFFPTIAALKNSTRGSLNLDLLIDFSFIGDVISLVQRYTLGAYSEYGAVSLFCGSIALLGGLGCFISKDIKICKKIIFGGMAILMVLIFYWNPFYILFSLLKDVSSYWCRYSYCGVVVILFFAAVYFLTTEYEKTSSVLLKNGCGFSFLLLLLKYLNNNQDRNRTYYTVLFILIIACTIVVITKLEDKEKFFQIVLKGCLFFVFTIEMMYSTKLQMDNYHVSDVKEYQEYVDKAKKQISSLHSFDDSAYRITQTSTRNMTEGNLTANYNEALAYNYWSISGYTSSPDDIQREFLDKLGYPINGENMCIVNISMLAADSLMGVKYILSEYPINGITKMNELEEINGKFVYKNPYCLPMAFIYNENGMKIEDDENPFVYQNNLFSKLVGKMTELYIPLEYHVEECSTNIEGNMNTCYSIKIPEGNYAIYGMIPWETYSDATLNVNDIYEMDYACWLSQNTFYIPTYNSEEEVHVILNSNIACDKTEGYFYALDLDKLSEINNKISERNVEKMILENGYVYIDVEATNNQRLYLSIPYDSGWNIKLNGKNIEPELFADCMYSIQLNDGTNVIEMTYEVKFLKLGVIVSVFSCIALSVICALEMKKRKGT